jgi:ribosomal protein L10
MEFCRVMNSAWKNRSLMPNSLMRPKKAVLSNLLMQSNKCLFTSLAAAKKTYPLEDTPQAQFNMSLYQTIVRQSKLVLFCQYNNLKFTNLNKLRFQALQKGIACKFIVSRHFEQLIETKEREGDDSYSALRILIAGPVVAFYPEQKAHDSAAEPEAFQELIEQLQGNAKLLFVGGWWEGKAYSHEAIKEVCTKLKSLTHIRQMLVSGVLEERAREIVAAVEHPMLELMHLLNIRAHEKAISNL